jgi:glycosyltransferase involved in cell wall biosynthesis
MPSISVVIPTFNRRHLVLKALSSVRSQTFAPSEIVIVDDCSTDDTADLLKELATTDKSIRPIILEENGGPAVARNAGALAARGEFVAFLDSDDSWTNRHLAECAEMFDAHPELDAVVGDLRRVSSGGSALEEMYLWYTRQIGKYIRPSPTLEGAFLFSTPERTALFEQYVMPVQTSVIRRRVFGAVVFNPALRGPEDWDFFLGLAFKGGKFGYCKEIHGECLIHDHNLVSNHQSPLCESQQFLRLWENLSARADLTPSERAGCRCRIAESHFDLGYQHASFGYLRDALPEYLRSFLIWPRLAPIRAGVTGIFKRTCAGTGRVSSS